MKIIKENGITMFAPESRPGCFDQPDDLDDGIASVAAAIINREISNV